MALLVLLLISGSGGALSSPLRTSPPPSILLSSTGSLATLTPTSSLPWPFHGVDRSGTEYACIQGWGYGDGPYNLTSVEAMRTWNVTAVRVPLNEDCWLDINVNGTSAAAWSGAGYRAFIVAYADLLESQGIRPILDLHWNAPGTNQSTGQEPMVDEDHGPAFWSSVASTFKNDSLVIFDLYNEPYGISWSCWLNGCFQTDTSPGWQTAGMQQLVDVVRVAGADTQMLMLGGLNYSNDASGWLSHEPTDPSGPGKLAASVHMYDFNACDTPSCWNSTILPIVQKGIPVVTGELGETDCNATFIESYWAWADPLHLSYLGWTWDTWNTCSGPVLISNYSGVPYEPYGVAWRAHLLGFPAPALVTPYAPQNVQGVAGNASIALSWAAPVTNGTWPVSEYEVEWGTAPGTLTWNRTLPGSVPLSLTLTGLTNGQPYEFAVRAGNPIGWGPLSTAGSATPVENLTVSFTLSATTGAAPLTVTFHALGQGGTPPYSIGWTFGDGSTGSGTWSNHTYVDPGTYEINATVNDTVRSWGSFPVGTVKVTGLPPLVAHITGGPVVGFSPLFVQFAGSATGGSGTYTYAWNFGDGSLGSTPGPTHTFTGNTTFETTLKVNDSVTLRSAETTFNVTVWTPLTLSRSVYYLSPAPSLNVTFQVEVQGGAGGYRFDWEFGDGANSSVPVPTHDYPRAGNYTTYLEVTDAAGHRVFSNYSVTVPTPTGSPGTSVPPSSPVGGLPTWLGQSSFGVPNLILVGLMVIGASMVVGGTLWARRRRPEPPMDLEVEPGPPSEPGL